MTLPGIVGHISDYIYDLRWIFGIVELKHLNLSVISSVKCALLIPHDILSIVLIIAILSSILSSISIISSGIGSRRGDTHATDSIPLNVEVIDVESQLFDALVVIITIIGDML